jgi:hypothetical protein
MTSIRDPDRLISMHGERAESPYLAGFHYRSKAFADDRGTIRH